MKKKVCFCRLGSKSCNNINTLLNVSLLFADILFKVDAYNILRRYIREEAFWAFLGEYLMRFVAYGLCA